MTGPPWSRVTVVVDFWAERCPPCQALSLVMKNMAAAFGDGLAVGKVEKRARWPSRNVRANSKGNHEQ